MAVAFRSVASATGTSTSPAVSVPSGAAAGDIAWVDLYLDSNATDTDATIAGLAAAGFSMHPTTMGTQGQGARGRGFIFWKRLTGADSGTYTFGQTVSVAWEISCRLYTGVTKVGTPWIVDIGATTSSAASSGTSVSIPSVTPGGSDSCLVGAAISHGSDTNAWSEPSGYTERYDGSSHLTAFDKAGPTAGSATGSITASKTSVSGTSYPKGYQIPLAGAGFVRVRSATAHQWSTLSSQTATLAAHDTGDLITIVVSGKYDDAAAPTISTATGWTLVASSTGGSGAQGTDTGMVFMYVYQKVAASSSETNPVFSVGSPSPNSWSAISVIATPADGKTWRDPVQTSSPAVVFINDVDTASPLTGTASALTGQPQTDDALVVFGVIPTDSPAAPPTVTLSATGLSNGTQSVNTVLSKTTLGADMGSAAADWMNFSGPATSGVTASMTFSAGAQAGLIGVVALRQESSVPAVTASWTGSGAFTASVVAVGVVAASWTGSGAFTASSVEVEQASAAWNGSGAFTATAFEVYDRTAAWAGSGTWTATVETDTAVNAAWDGTGAFSATAFPVGVVAADWTGSGAFSASVLPVEVISAAWGGSGSWTAAVEVVSEGVSADWTGSGAWSADVIAVVPPFGDTSNRDDGIDLEGTAEVIWEPDVVPVPELIGPRLESDVRTAAQVIDTAPGRLPDFTAATGRRQYAPALRERVLVSGKDVTFLDDVPVQVGDIRLIDPLRYGAASITFPQIDPEFVTLGVGDFAWVKDFAPVVIQLVDADDVVVVPDYYKGFVTRINEDGPALSFDLGGQASGALSLLPVPNTVYRRKQDVEHICVDLLRDARVRAHEHEGSSGVGIIKHGAADGLTIFNETLAVWAGATGSPITFTPRADGAYRKTVKDTTTIHGTVYIDRSLISRSISRDLASENRRVYASGFTAAGELVTNVKTPGMTQGDTPDFPLASGSLVIDMTDDDTTTGAGITALQEQLALHNWLDILDAEQGVFDAATAAAVFAFKEQAGLADLTPSVNVSAWNRLWNLTKVGYSLDDAREYPMAEDPAVRKWDRTANGSKIAENPLYDPHVKPVGEFIDVGGPFKRGEIAEFAQSRLRTEDVWIGTLTFRSGLVAGEHNPGDPFDAADVMDRRELLPNMRLWAPYFQGGKVFYVSEVTHGPDESTAAVSTKPETSYETWTAISRVREAKSNVARMAQGHVRASQVRRDTGPSWDTSSGWLANKVPLVAGWNEVKVPAGQEGIVERIKMQLDYPREFAALLTQKPVSLDALTNRVDPLAAPPPDPQRHRIVVVGSPTGGTFTLSGNGNESTALGFRPTAPAVQAAVRGLGGAFSDATVVRTDAGALLVTMHGGDDNLNVGSNDLTGGSDATISVTSTGPSAGDGTPWYELEAIVDWLKGRGYLDAWGTPDQPCGYDPRPKTDGHGPTAAAITGLFVDEAGLNYATGSEPVLYLYLWVSVENKLLPGRILRNQRTADF